MTLRHYAIWASTAGAASGLVGWLTYSELFAIITRPVHEWIVGYSESEVTMQRMKATVAFVALGISIAFASGLIRGFRVRQGYGLTFGTLVAAAAVLVSAMIFWLYLDMSSMAWYAANGGMNCLNVPLALRYTAVPLHHVAAYPAIFLVFLGITVWIGAYMKQRHRKSANKSRMSTAP